MNLLKFINLFNKTNDFIKNDKFASQNWKGIISKKENRFADKDLSSWIGLGGPDMSKVRVLVNFRTFRFQN